MVQAHTRSSKLASSARPDTPPPTPLGVPGRACVHAGGVKTLQPATSGPRGSEAGPRPATAGGASGGGAPPAADAPADAGAAAAAAAAAVPGPSGASGGDPGEGAAEQGGPPAAQLDEVSPLPAPAPTPVSPSFKPHHHRPAPSPGTHGSLPLAWHPAECWAWRSADLACCVAPPQEVRALRQQLAARDEQLEALRRQLALLQPAPGASSAAGAAPADEAP
jgi:hypothetical protein